MMATMGAPRWCRRDRFMPARKAEEVQEGARPLSPDEIPEPDFYPDLPDRLSGIAGIDLVRRALEEARGAARAQGKDIGHGRQLPAARRVVGSGGRRRWSGPGPDSRDPQSLSVVARDVAKTRGWSPRVAEGAVFGRWSSVVGENIAEHATPTVLRDGVLTVSAESTAWATQLRHIQAQVLAKIAAEIGDGVVTALKITGPVAPSWRKGPLHISGRGPRDTYG
jgi:predicted nucleic acid-binding Zn ribbon protein